jgi:hypothetical protein
VVGECSIPGGSLAEWKLKCRRVWTIGCVLRFLELAGHWLPHWHMRTPILLPQEARQEHVVGECSAGQIICWVKASNDFIWEFDCIGYIHPAASINTGRSTLRTSAWCVLFSSTHDSEVEVDVFAYGHVCKCIANTRMPAHCLRRPCNVRPMSARRNIVSDLKLSIKMICYWSNIAACVFMMRL